MLNNNKKNLVIKYYIYENYACINRCVLTFSLKEFSLKKFVMEFSAKQQKVLKVRHVAL